LFAAPKAEAAEAAEASEAGVVREEAAVAAHTRCCCAAISKATLAPSGPAPAYTTLSPAWS